MHTTLYIFYNRLLGEGSIIRLRFVKTGSYKNIWWIKNINLIVFIWLVSWSNLNLNRLRWNHLTFFSLPLFFLLFCHSQQKCSKNKILKKTDIAISKWMCYYSLHSSDQCWMCHCLSPAVVPQLTVLPRLLSSAMHVTPGLLPVRRCWWDGSLTGPAAAPDMLLIYNAQLWQRNQRCLYAKPAGAKTWWEMSHSLSLPRWHTLDALTVS